MYENRGHEIVRVKFSEDSRISTQARTPAHGSGRRVSVLPSSGRRGGLLGKERLKFLLYIVVSSRVGFWVISLSFLFAMSNCLENSRIHRQNPQLTAAPVPKSGGKTATATITLITY
jgi:hypothetical protein